MSQKQTLVIIDGYSFLFRAYFSMPPLSTPDGTPAGAVYGFVTMLTRILKHEQINPTHLLIALDSGEDSFRKKIYNRYKSNRPKPPEDLIPQFALVREAIEAFGIKRLDMPELEADDIIACYTKTALAANMDVIIASSDKDLMQLVNDDVRLYDSFKNIFIDENYVKEKFGVTPSLLRDLLSLMGDSSDFIPGVAGVGPKTAAKLLNDNGSLEKIYENIENVTPIGLKTKLITDRENAFLSQKLVQLVCEWEMPLSLEDLLYKEIHYPTLIPFLQKQGFKSLISRLGRDGVKDTSQNEKLQQASLFAEEEPASESAQTEVRYIDNIEEFDKIIDQISANDLEVKIGYNPKLRLLCIDSKTIGDNQLICVRL